MKYRLLITTISALFLAGSVTAQTPDPGPVKLQYTKEAIGGINVHTNGWGGTFRYGVHKTGYSRHIFGGDLVFMKHHKEVKSYNPWYEDSKGYIYGKENSFFILRGWYGQRYSFTDKLRERGVDFGIIWGVGASLGFTKPIYLEIGHPSVPYEYITVERYDSGEHYIDNIYGKAPGTKGLNELGFHPGAHAKFGLLFEYSPDKDGLKALEVGMAVDAFPAKIPIMALTENKQLFYTLYLNLMFGKKFIR